MSQSNAALTPDPRSAPLPTTFAGFRGIHTGERIVVCGCGTSLRDFTQPERYITIGVNDVGRMFQPDYLVVVNHRRQFHGDRFQYVASSTARALFSHIDLGVPHANSVRFGLGKRCGTDIDDADRLPFTRNSPYVAVCLALHMGARRIGLIGVDFTDHHFFQNSGIHSLAREINQIDAEYRRLVEIWQARGVEICNLSPISRLVSVPRVSLDTFETSHALLCPTLVPDAPTRVFFVNYRFLSAGEVFTRGLRHAAKTIGAVSGEAYWDDPLLAAKVSAFDPDLLFVVHGRRFARAFRDLAPRAFKAVWLVDEPYEVDDTAAWSKRFDAVFVNDPSTLGRHQNARYLPVAFDPSTHFPGAGERPHAVGFIGGYNAIRETTLLRLLDENLLSYVVGGPWRSPRLRAICLSPNISAEETAALYRQTRIVVNVFREQHHYNREHIAGFSLNPRVYEALACGALVVSEHRPEPETVFPAMPLFRSPDELVSHVRRLLEDRTAFDNALAACRAALVGHDYADRLRRVIEVIPKRNPIARAPAASRTLPAWTDRAAISVAAPAGWAIAGTAGVTQADDRIVLSAGRASSSGAEVGLASLEAHAAVRLSFELRLEPGSQFIAKLHQQSQLDQTTNSYHLVLDDRRAFIAKHHAVLRDLCRPLGETIDVELVWASGILSGHLDEQPIPDIVADAMPSGFCFVGLNRGKATLRRLRIETDIKAAVTLPRGVIVLGPGASPSVPGFVTLDAGTTIASEQSFTDIELACEVAIDPAASLIVKLHQQAQDNGSANSYHLLSKPDGAYIARHHCLFTPVTMRRDGFIRLRMRRAGTRLQVFVNDAMVAHVEDANLRDGYCAIGVSGGTARLHGVRLVPLGPGDIASTIAISAPLRARAPVGRRGAPSREIPAVQLFKVMPKRHLMYHVWPVKGSVWRWNLEMLLERIELFNGRRVVGVVQDSSTDDVAEVKALLNGHGCEVLLFPNDRLGEVVTFPHLVSAADASDPDGVTFYGHAKGVKYREAISAPVRRWTETLYRTCLDDWRSVRAALNNHAVAGSFRKLGPSRPHHNMGDWHFSGTFFWVRNSHLHPDRTLDVPRFYGGVEAWPGLHFPLSQSACLFLDDMRQPPYLDEFWRRTGEPEFARWQATRKALAPPPDLIRPVPFEGYATPRLEQKPDEMAWLLQRILDIKPARVLTIGARHGGFEWHLARTARARGQEISITSIEIDPGPEVMRTFTEIRERFGQQARLIKADSSSADARNQVAGQYDAVMIDGDHGYRGARNDWELVRSLNPKLVAFHDIVDSDWHAVAKCCVSRLWAELKASHATSECVSGEWGGAGIVMP